MKTGKRVLKHFLSMALLMVTMATVAQKNKRDNEVYVDKNGVMRYTKGNGEAAFFGVNYTVPFAYGYRSVQRLGITPQQAIDDDVYHMARLGFNAFRVHMWDNEITDSAGNLQDNEHLRLFDYLISKLKERGIKTFLTPLAYWRGGYPEPEPNTGAFSSLYDKREVLVTEAAIKAQENYVRQLLNHVNPYTKTTYGGDKDVIALEINNEPHHSGTREGVAAYINRMIAAVRSTGWSKPLYYNISESPSYAGVVAMAKIDGVSFQWYPTGLVANRTLQGNYLPNVDWYKIPFTDSLPAFRNKAKMVYEFDAGDVAHSYMYPAMARSFRTAGFQWATQFAYDPMATAYANTEYQTHYLNLAYTPSKAISLLIAGKAFHGVPRLKNYGTYPADTLFENFRVSYESNLSEMNSKREFYHSNATNTKPLNTAKLQHIAGVGTSPIVQYKGYGAYFLDKIEEGVWRLEVMPDAIAIRDPFERASPQKEVTRIQWQAQRMQLMLPDLGNDFSITAINKGNHLKAVAESGSFTIQPGTYLVKSNQKENKTFNATAAKVGAIGLNEFIAPQPFGTTPFVAHQPHAEVTAGVPFTITAKAVGVDSADKLSVELRNTSGAWKTVVMQRLTPYDYTAQVPAEMVTPGVINYRIILQKGKETFLVYPGNHHGNPYAWDNYTNESWETFVAAPGAPLFLFNAATDRAQLNIYNSNWQKNKVVYITGTQPKQLILKATMGATNVANTLGWQLYIGDKVSARKTEMAGYNKLVVVARAAGTETITVRIGLIDRVGKAFATEVQAEATWKEIEIPLSGLKPDSGLLLPRPYPGFLPLWFKTATNTPYNLMEMDKLEISISGNGKPLGVELQSVYLEK